MKEQCELALGELSCLLELLWVQLHKTMVNGGSHLNYNKIEVGGHLVCGGNCSRPGSQEDKRQEEDLMNNDVACVSVHSAILNLLVQHFNAQG